MIEYDTFMILKIEIQTGKLVGAQLVLPPPLKDPLCVVHLGGGVYYDVFFFNVCFYFYLCFCICLFFIIP